MNWREHSQTSAIPGVCMSRIEFPESTFDRTLTQVLHILIRNKLHHDCRHISLDAPGEMPFVHDNPICHRRRDEGQAISDLGRLGRVVEEDVGERVAEDGKQQRYVPGWGKQPAFLRVYSRRPTRRTMQTCDDAELVLGHIDRVMKHTAAFAPEPSAVRPEAGLQQEEEPWREWDVPSAPDGRGKWRQESRFGARGVVSVDYLKLRR